MSDSVFRLDGACLLDEAAEALALADLDDHVDVDTIGGLVTKVLGRQPRAEDQVTLGGFRVIVESAQGFRIRTLRFERLQMEQVSA